MKKILRNRHNIVDISLGRMLIISPELGVVRSRLDGKDSPDCRCISLYPEDPMVFSFALVRDRVEVQNRIGQAIHICGKVVPTLVVLKRV